jgi:hypothetical protein
MLAREIFRRFSSALPREGELRLGSAKESLLITRHDSPYTIISALAKTGSTTGWATLEVDGQNISLLQSHAVDTVLSVLNRLAPAA